MLVRDRRGLARDVRGDVGVAVAVGADPRPELDERLDGRRLGARAVAVHPAVEAAVHLRERGEEGLVEHAHRGPHLVERRRLARAERRGAPQLVDLGQQAARVVGERDPAELLELAPLHEHGDATDAGGDRASSGLGGVGREDGAELERLEATGRLPGTDLAHELGVRGRERVLGAGLRRGQSRLALAQHPHAVVLLREVHEVEVGGERLRHVLGALRREGRDELLGLLDRGRRAVLRRCLDGQRTEALDVVQEVLAAPLPEHGAEHLAQQPDVRAQRFGHLVPGMSAFYVVRHHGSEGTHLSVPRVPAAGSWARAVGEHGCARGA